MTEEVLQICMELVEQGKVIVYAAGNANLCLNGNEFLQNPY